MLKKLAIKIRNFFAPFLLHPVATAMVVLTGIVSSLTGIGAELQQIGFQFGPLAYYVPKAQKYILFCMVISTVCTLLGGMGRSFISFVDSNLNPKKADITPGETLPKPV